MTQQHWGSQPQFGQRPQFGQQGGQWNQPGYGPGAPLGPNVGGGPQPGQFGGPGGFPPPAGQRQKNPLKKVLGAMIALTLVALVGFVAVGLVGGSSNVAYQNDDYQVPPPDANPPEIPVPQTYEEATTFVTDNPFYRQSTPAPVRCELPRIDVTKASDAELKTHFEGLTACLIRVWQPPVEGAKYKIVRPTVTIYGAEAQTKCGKSGVNAFYCTADQQVYFSNQLASAVPTIKKTNWAADVVMAHEFGHALQARTGILISSHALAQNSGEKQTELELNRRLEVQADCFSGMFIRSVSVSLGVQQSDLAAIESVYVAVGDDTVSGKPNIVGDHGRAGSRKYWGDVGLGNQQIGTCNTYKAASKLVR